MAIYFVDSSALLKRFHKESGSARVLDLLENAAVEVSASLTRRAKATQMLREDLLATLALLDADFARSFEITEVERRIMDQAVLIARAHGLKGADSIQLASALFVRRDVISSAVTLLSADDELNAAAAAEGLQVENPNRQS